MVDRSKFRKNVVVMEAKNWGWKGEGERRADGRGMDGGRELDEMSDCVKLHTHHSPCQGLIDKTGPFFQAEENTAYRGEGEGGAAQHNTEQPATHH